MKIRVIEMDTKNNEQTSQKNSKDSEFEEEIKKIEPQWWTLAKKLIGNEKNKEK